jgi:SAM-dependent methyltransferase
MLSRGLVVAMPHSTWAQVYDRVYERSFGELLERLTSRTLEVVVTHAVPLARIVDFGAGTGRVALPLADRGYQVTAVEPCQEMLDELARKPGEESVRKLCQRMEEFRTAEPFDVALCLFSVLAYLLDEEALEQSLRAMGAALRPGGLLLLDIPSAALFRGGRSTAIGLDRRIEITSAGGDLHLFHEDTRVDVAGEIIAYADAFQIRFWDPECVLKILARSGLIQKADLSLVFAGSLANYFLLEKAPG